MEIQSIIVDHDPPVSTYLKKCILSNFPEIAVQGEASNYLQACKMIEEVAPNLVFMDINVLENYPVSLLSPNRSIPFELIYISNRPEDAIRAIRDNVCGFILKPLNVSDIVVSVKNALGKFSEGYSKRMTETALTGENAFLPHKKLLGIPTIEGIDFLYIHEIIRCEGLQKCTRVISTQKHNMISSYGIGEFRNLLEEYGFFGCHKSHLINLMHVKKFTREGFVYLSDNIAVPLARRKRTSFLHQLKHL